MEQQSALTGNLLVATKQAFAFVKVNGRASFKLAPSLKRFCTKATHQGCREIIFDMEDCFAMDSTFMGVLAGIAIHPIGDKPHRVVIMNLTPKTHGMLSSLGLERVLECHEQGDVPGALHQQIRGVLQLDDLEDRNGTDSKVSLETMLQAHQHLVDLNPDNLVRFRDVLTYLDQEAQSFNTKRS